MSPGSKPAGRQQRRPQQQSTGQKTSQSSTGGRQQPENSLGARPPVGLLWPAAYNDQAGRWCDVTVEADELLTIGQLARRLAVPEHRLDYAIRTAGIQPAARLGILRGFSESQLGDIRRALSRTERRSRARASL